MNAVWRESLVAEGQHPLTWAICCLRPLGGSMEQRDPLSNTLRRFLGLRKRDSGSTGPARHTQANRIVCSLRPGVSDLRPSINRSLLVFVAVVDPQSLPEARPTVT